METLQTSQEVSLDLVSPMDSGTPGSPSAGQTVVKGEAWESLHVRFCTIKHKHNRWGKIKE